MAQWIVGFSRVYVAQSLEQTQPTPTQPEPQICQLACIGLPLGQDGFGLLVAGFERFGIAMPHFLFTPIRLASGPCQRCSFQCGSSLQSQASSKNSPVGGVCYC